MPVLPEDQVEAVQGQAVLTKSIKVNESNGGIHQMAVKAPCPGFIMTGLTSELLTRPLKNQEYLHFGGHGCGQKPVRFLSR